MGLRAPIGAQPPVHPLGQTYSSRACSSRACSCLIRRRSLASPEAASAPGLLQRERPDRHAPSAPGRTAHEGGGHARSKRRSGWPDVVHCRRGPWLQGRLAARSALQPHRHHGVSLRP